LGELLEPLHHGAIAGNTGQTTEPREQRIAGDVAQVMEPPRLTTSNAITSQVATAVVATELVLTEASAETLGQTDELEVAALQLQLAAGSKLFTTQFDRKIPLDHPPQPPYLEAHLWGPPVSRGVVDYALYTTHERPFFFNQSISTGKNFCSAVVRKRKPRLSPE